MSLLPDPVIQSRLSQLWEVASDLLIAIGLIWTLPILLGVVGALVNVLVETR